MHNDSAVRTVHLPPYKSISGWDISEYRDRWDFLEQKLKTCLLLQWTTISVRMVGNFIVCRNGALPTARLR